MAEGRRSRRRLEADLASARSDADRARAHYALALFHDNNSREAEAIPHYRRALALGLPTETASAAWAWLASSLWKSGAPEPALEAIARTRQETKSPQLAAFLARLERRIRKGPTERAKR
jgi:tetratricopeptide (TPR) repeat protein